MRLKKDYSKVFDSIDTLPIWNWEQVHKTSNLAFLRIQPHYKDVEVEFSERLERIWGGIYDEFIQEFGFSPEYEELLDAKIEVAELKNDYIQTGQRALLNNIRIAEYKLEGTEVKTESNLRKNIQHIVKFTGTRYNVKEMTVAEYYGAIEMIKDYGKD